MWILLPVLTPVVGRALLPADHEWRYNGTLKLAASVNPFVQAVVLTNGSPGKWTKPRQAKRNYRWPHKQYDKPGTRPRLSDTLAVVGSSSAVNLSVGLALLLLARRRCPKTLV
jgi:hypothetical protein